MKSKLQISEIAKKLKPLGISLTFLSIPLIQKDFNEFFYDIEDLILENIEDLLKSISKDIKISETNEEITYGDYDFGYSCNLDDISNVVHHVMLEKDLVFLACFEKKISNNTTRLRWIASKTLSELIDAAINHPDYR